MCMALSERNYPLPFGGVMIKFGEYRVSYFILFSQKQYSIAECNLMC